MVREILKPIILLGSARSGTTLLGNIFAHHPDVAYWLEPRPVWMYGHAYRAHYELTAADLKPRIARGIDRRFGRFLARSGRKRFAEKTPSNCLRIGFIRALYPDCRMINIIRDGREVVASSLRMQAMPLKRERVISRVFETPIWEWPAYVPRSIRHLWNTGVRKRRVGYWGTKPVGWEDWVGLPPHLIAANQWKRVVEISTRHGRSLPAENYLEIRFDRLMREPVPLVREMIAFTDLPHSDEMLEHAARHVDPGRATTSIRNLTLTQLRESEEAMAPWLAELGFPAQLPDAAVLPPGTAAGA